MSYDQFELALRSGTLLLILDGFDEVEHTHRDSISKQISDISIKYPDTIIIVSSRPDEKFPAWQSFYTFKICPLSKKQVLILLKQIPYDSDLKKTVPTRGG